MVVNGPDCDRVWTPHDRAEFEAREQAKAYTDAERALSYETVKHLDAWLNAYLSNRPLVEFIKTRERMIKLTAHDEDYWSRKGWRYVLDHLNTVDQANQK